jgi:RNA polymerase sigma-70 factor, ECF subfamily
LRDSLEPLRIATTLTWEDAGVKSTSYNDTQGPLESGYRSSTSVAREVELIARIAEGDRKAFEELYHLYHRRLARFLTRLTKRYDVAEEVINDTFWVVWRKAHTFRGESQPSTWILGIAYRKARNAFRSASRELPGENLEASPPPLTTDEPLRAQELRDWLVQALVQLPVEQRLAVELCYELGFSCEEIAGIMNCPVNTVKTRLFHARAKLQKLLPALGGSVLREDGADVTHSGGSRKP